MAQATPAITWSAPAGITYGTALDVTQLNATASVPGTFTYDPLAGTILGAGTRTLSVTFTPTDAVNYAGASKSVSIGVAQAAPVITWGAPAGITYGTALGATQLNAAAGVPGTFTYDPLAGTVLNAGTRTLSVTFTPTDAANYTGASKSIAIDVAQATPTITWSAPAGIAYGTALGATQLNATASVPGTLTYDPLAGTVLNAGTRTLSATFTPTDTANYTAATRSVVITVAKATPTITWHSPADILFGAALSATQLNATASVPGTFVYTPALAEVLAAGVHSLSVTFSPTDAANYTTATKTVSVTVRGDARVTVDKTSVGSAAIVTAFVADGPGNVGDWVALYATGASTYLQWKYLNASQVAPAAGLVDAVVPFTMPMAPGTYLVRFYTGSTLLSTSAPITVAGTTITVSTTSVTAGNAVTATVGNGPGNATDWIGLYAAGGGALLNWKYLNGAQTAPAAGMTGATVAFTMPMTPGSYKLRFSTGTISLVTSPTITVGGVTFTVSATTAAPLDIVTVTIANGPGHVGDWVGLYAIRRHKLSGLEVPERGADASGHGSDRRHDTLLDADDAGHVHAATLHRQHAPGDEPRHHGRRASRGDIHDQRDGGGTARYGHRDHCQRTGQHRRLDRAVCDGRIRAAGLAVSERHEDAPGRRPDRRDGALPDADRAGLVCPAVVDSHQAAGDESADYRRRRDAHRHHDDGGAPSHRNGDHHQRPGARRRLGGPVCGRRHELSRLDVSERGADAPGHGFDERQCGVHDADNAGLLSPAVLLRPDGAGDEPDHHGRRAHGAGVHRESGDDRTGRNGHRDDRQRAGQSDGLGGAVSRRTDRHCWTGIS